MAQPPKMLLYMDTAHIGLLTSTTPKLMDGCKAELNTGSEIDYIGIGICTGGQ